MMQIAYVPTHTIYSERYRCNECGGEFLDEYVVQFSYPSTCFLWFHSQCARRLAADLVEDIDNAIAKVVIPAILG